MCAQSRTHSDQANNAWPLSSALDFTIMKNTYLFALVTIIISIASAHAETSEYKQIKSLIESQKYEEAAKLVAKSENSKKHVGYHFIGFYLSGKNRNGEHSKTIKEYYIKGCKGQTEVSCVDYGKMLEHYGEYNEAEKVYSAIQNKHKDAYSSERLYLLYNKKEWEGYDAIKSKYWRNIYIDKMQENRMKREKALIKYGLKSE